MELLLVGLGLGVSWAMCESCLGWLGRLSEGKEVYRERFDEARCWTVG